jgi:hypothetical protein
VELSKCFVCNEELKKAGWGWRGSPKSPTSPTSREIGKANFYCGFTRMDADRSKSGANLKFEKFAFRWQTEPAELFASEEASRILRGYEV